MTPQRTIKQVVLILMTGMCALGATPLDAYGPYEDAFEEKPTEPNTLYKKRIAWL